MRKPIIIALGILVLAGILICLWLIPAKPKAGPWRLADGSELSLAGVTYGKNHAMRYGNRLVDYLYPILPNALRNKLGCKVAIVTNIGPNSTMLWIWHKGLPPPKKTSAGFPRFAYDLTVVDENGLESWMPMYSYYTVTWQKTNFLQGFVVGMYPRRSREIGIRFREPRGPRVVGEFKIQNRAGTNFPVWNAGPLPVTVKTNDMEISLVTFETGLVERGRRSGSRAVLELTKYGRPCDDWIMQAMWVQSSTGERYDSPLWSTTTYGSGGTAVAMGRMTLWPEEPGWKVTAQFWRTTNYPPDELWTVKGIPIPTAGATKDVNLTTNLAGSEIQVMGISGGTVLTGKIENSKPGRGPVALHLTSPIPSLDRHLRLAEVRDDQGRKVDFHFEHETPSTGGRGATVRQLDKDYLLYPEEDAKNLEVTLAYTKTVSVEFMAKPTVAK